MGFAESMLFQFRLFIDKFCRSSNRHFYPGARNGVKSCLMNILVIGTGAVGGYYGAKMATAGHDVYFTARGTHLEILRERGLTVESPQGDFHIKPTVGEKFERLENLDLIMVCVKHYDLDAVLPMVAEQVGEKTVVMSLLNGVDSEKIIMKALPPGHVVGGIAFIGAELAGPGVIRHTSAGRLTIGEVDASITERIEELSTAFTKAGIPCKPTGNFQKALWEKLLWNAGFNALAALTGHTAQQILSYGPTKIIVRRLMEEVVAVADKLDMEIDPRLVDKNIELTAKAPEIVPSMLQDVRRGKTTEIEAINGKVFREGRKADVPVPFNEILWAAVSLMDRATPET